MKQLKSRAGTLNEIIKSEAAYVQYLTVLMEVRVVGRVRVRRGAFAVNANDWGYWWGCAQAFAVPIRQKEVLRLDDQLCLFANIGSVLSLHRRFLGDLKDRYANWYAPLLPRTPLLAATPHDTHPTLARHTRQNNGLTGLIAQQQAVMSIGRWPTSRSCRT